MPCVLLPSNRLTFQPSPCKIISMSESDSSQQSDEAGLTAQLKNLLRDVCAYFSSASEDEKQRLLGTLQDLWRGYQREYPRKSCFIPVTCATSDGVFTDFVRNISAGGVFIETSEPFSVGQQLKLMFWPTDGEEPIKTTGKIMWRGPGGVGVKFTTPCNDLETMIESLWPVRVNSPF